VRRNPTGSPRQSFLLTAVLFGLAATVLCWACSRVDRSGEMEALTIGVPPLEQNALLYVADHESYFANRGLRVVIKDYDSGVTAIDAMVKGEVDIAEAAEFPFVRAVFQDEKILLIACNDKFENDYIVGRKDRGITRIPDLKGKRIGVALKTINEFYLGRFLALNGIDLTEVTLIDIAPALFVKAIADRDIDAIIAWEPYVHQIRKEIKDIVLWPAQGSQAAYGVLVCSSGWLAEHKDTVKRFLGCLGEAEEYLVRHPDEARRIVQRRLNYDESYISSVWPRHRFSLSLDQTLTVAMKDEAQWMIDNNLTKEKIVPDFMNYIYPDGLKAAKPEALNIVR
jgi:NitT/TauT family transport system substrate-binding protein